MRLATVATLIFLSNSLFAGDSENLRHYFNLLSKLEFDEAKRLAHQQEDDALSSEMFRLAEILSNAGQTEKPSLDSISDMFQENYLLEFLRRLQYGYINFFYDQAKGGAYAEFYSAYQIAMTRDDDVLLKASLLAMLEYYRNEVAESAEARLPYLRQFESIQHDTIDNVWLTVYKSVFFTSTLKDVDSGYFALAKDLNIAEQNLEPESPVLAYVFYEKALNFEILRVPGQDLVYYTKAFDQAKNHRFLWYLRFSSCIKLMMIATYEGRFDDARFFFNKAKAEINSNNESRTSYWLNLYGAEFLNASHHSDSAYLLMRTALQQGFLQDFRKNTLAINRLNVELDTQEKVNANLRLTQERNWLISSLAGLGLLAAVGYLTYRNRLAKSSLKIQEREMHSIKLEKQLKDQEIAGIDHMIEAQEKERQRIANELHDHLGSHLASIKLYFQNLQQKANDPAQEELFQKTDQLLEETYQQVRTLAHARNVGVNSKDGLMPAVKTFAARISASNSLTVDVEEHGMDTRLENSLEILLFRIVQELTTNVIKHAKASEVTISLTRHEDSINLMVEDNGAGFDASQIKPRDTMGLHSIQKRVENLGGTVTVDSILNSGTTVIVDLPI